MAFLFCLLIGPYFIAYLKKKQFFEKVEKKDSEILAKMSESKKGTPTMGGLFISASIIFSALLWTRLDNIFVVLCILTVLEFTILGYIDDYIKFSSPNKKGITKSFKLFAQCAIGLIIGIALYYHFQDNVPNGTSVYLPVLKTHVELGIFYPVFVMIVITASSNAVNLTDGLDGLAGGCLLMAGLAFAVITYIVGRTDYTSYLGITFVNGCAELTILCAAMIGAIVGFLWFNCYPAQVFMGNAGALPLGGVLGVIAVVAKQEMLLFAVGFIFVLETVSVIIQIIAYRGWGKRVFKCAPLHHHYQFMDLHEAKITIRFWIIAGILALLTIASLKF